MIVIKREAISEAGFRPCSTEGPKGGGGGEMRRLSDQSPCADGDKNGFAGQFSESLL